MTGVGEAVVANRQNLNTRTLESAEHDRDVALYKAGRTYRQTAAHFKMSLSATHSAVQRAIAAAPAVAGQEIRAEELVKLDALEAAAWEVLRANHIHVSDGRVVKDADQPITDHKPVLMAIDRILRCQERRARMLGLDAPTRQTITVLTEDVVDAAIRQELAAMEALDADLTAAGGSTTGEASAAR